jgi:hypothetical protein
MKVLKSLFTILVISLVLLNGCNSAEKVEQARIAQEQELENSRVYFNEAMKLYETNYFEDALIKFRYVREIDKDNYEIAQSKIKELTDILYDGFFTNAKKAYEGKNYSVAFTLIMRAKSLKDNEETNTLSDKYYKAKQDAENQQAKEVKKSQGVRIGMTKQEVLDSNWGQPKSINKTITKNSEHEQWVYDNYNYLYFDDGILTSIQTH